MTSVAPRLALTPPFLAIVLVASNFMVSSGQQQKDQQQQEYREPSNKVYFQNQNQIVGGHNQEPPWPLINTASGLGPANVPNVITQEQAKRFGQFLKNQMPQDQLDLASMNFRGSEQAATERKVIPLKPNRQNNIGSSNITSQVDDASNQAIKVGRQGKDVMHPRLDVFGKYKAPSFLETSLGHSDAATYGSSNGVVSSSSSGGSRGSGSSSSALSYATDSKKAFLSVLAQNCITRSIPRSHTCEDHLIKRLRQDATEGRTVIDVGRRVCCALFWHKDCINRVVVETCPDSSPEAAKYLLGSRNLDLTLSCQRFNRDGCNGTVGIKYGQNYWLLVTLIGLTLMMVVDLSGRNFD